jgi:hypothetical protein
MAMMDEDPERTRSVGVLQLMNKIGGEITQEDLRRLFYIRKLVGAQTERSHWMEECL